MDGCPPFSPSVSPGDKMKVTITTSYSSGSASILLKDTTKAWTYKSVEAASSTNEASWLLQSEYLTLANFGTLKTSSNYVTISGHHGTMMSFSSSEEIYKDTLVDSMGHTMATTSSLSSTGSAFSIKWVSST
jgi:hypothetical protein